MSTPPRYHRDPPHAELDWADLKARLAFSHGAETVALIGAGRHPPTEADLQAWRALGRSEPKMDVEDMPSAEAVARAVVASAAILGEDPLSIAGGGWCRARLPALKALKVFYPAYSWDRLGRLVGIPDTAQPRVQSAQRSAWWPELGEAAYLAAFEALEAL